MCADLERQKMSKTIFYNFLFFRWSTRWWWQCTPASCLLIWIDWSIDWLNDWLIIVDYWLIALVSSSSLIYCPSLPVNLSAQIFLFTRTVPWQAWTWQAWTWQAWTWQAWTWQAWTWQAWTWQAFCETMRPISETQCTFPVLYINGNLVKGKTLHRTIVSLRNIRVNCNDI
jgi:hypothetical protein